MNPLVKPRWIERLRSGDYEQGTNALNRDGKLCCLGVLMEIAVEEGIVIREEGNGEFCYRDSADSTQAWSSLTVDALHWADIPTPVVNDLMRMNDMKAQTFLEIADYIEENL